MRETFPGYYRPTEDEFSELWDNCLFVLDANVLLNLYRYSRETREELIGILEEISDRLWVPHQAALEYHRNRLEVIEQQAAAYDKIQKLLNDAQKKLWNELRSSARPGRHPFIEVDHLLEKIEIVFTEIKEELKELKQEHPDLLDEDPIRDAIATLLEGKIGSPHPSERMNESTEKTRLCKPKRVEGSSLSARSFAIETKKKQKEKRQGLVDYVLLLSGLSFLLSWHSLARPSSDRFAAYCS